MKKSKEFPADKLKKGNEYLKTAPNAPASNAVNSMQPLKDLCLNWFGENKKYRSELLCFCVVEEPERISLESGLSEIRHFLKESTPPDNNIAVIIGPATVKAWGLGASFLSISQLESILKKKKLDGSFTILIQPNKRKFCLYDGGLQAGEPFQELSFDDLVIKTAEPIDGLKICLNEAEAFHDMHTHSGHSPRLWTDRPKWVTCQKLEEKIHQILSVFMRSGLRRFGGIVQDEGDCSDGRYDMHILFPDVAGQNTIIELKALRTSSSDGTKKPFNYTKKQRSEAIAEGIEQTQAYKNATKAAHAIFAVFNAHKDDEDVLQKHATAEGTKRGFSLGWYRMYADTKKARAAKNAKP